MKDIQKELITEMKNLSNAINALTKMIGSYSRKDKQRRRHFKIDSFPFRDEIDSLLKSGATFTDVQEFIESKGESCSLSSISSYFAERIRKNVKL